MKSKIFKLSVSCIILCLHSLAQPTITGQKTIGGNNDDFVTSSFLTNDGGMVIGGFSKSTKSGEKKQDSRGGFDYWIVKLNSHSKIQWSKTIGGNQDDYLRCLQQTSDGGYILGGYSPSGISGEKTDGSRGADDYWVVKLDSLGNILWDKTIGGSTYDDLYSLQQTTDGGYILGGTSLSPISGEKTQKSRGNYDYWIVKLDSLGNIVWDKTVGGTGSDILTALQQTSDGGYILGGYSPSNISAQKTQNSRGSNDYWVVKLNSNGSIQWDKTIGGAAFDELYSLQQANDGGYILGGYSESNISGEKIENSRGVHDYWVVKLDGAGNIQWDKTIGGSSYDDLQSLEQTSDGGYILGGSSQSNISGEKTENSRGGDDYWVVKLNGAGNIQWDKTIGGNSYDFLYSVREIKKNHYALGGTSGSGISADKTDTSRGYDDYWIVFLNYNKQTPTVEYNSFSAQKNTNEFIVYPNPAKDILHVQTNNKTVITLSGASGKILLTKAIDGSGIIDVSKFSEGVYYLKNNSTGEVQKLVVVR